MNYFVNSLFLFFTVSAIKVNEDEPTVNYNSLDDITCSLNVTLYDLKIILYTKTYADVGIPLHEETYNEINPNNFTTIIIHGWMQDGNRTWIKQMKDAYLNKASVNIIVLDWSHYSGINYMDAVCAVPKVGELTGDLIYNLTKFGVATNKIQINGFSLGAHVAGAAGQRVIKLTNSKIKRINGLDAAGPSFHSKPESERLDQSDADFVQAIHTNGNRNGYGPNYGTIDFYINYSLLFGCGSVQNGCPLNPGVTNEDSLFPYLFCDHIRAVAYYIESITSDEFLAVTCSSCSDFRKGLCSSNAKTVMGENCSFNQSGVRYLNTNFNSPFAESANNNNDDYSFWIF